MGHIFLPLLFNLLKPRTWRLLIQFRGPPCVERFLALQCPAHFPREMEGLLQGGPTPFCAASLYYMLCSSRSTAVQWPFNGHSTAVQRPFNGRSVKPMVLAKCQVREKSILKGILSNVLNL